MASEAVIEIEMATTNASDLSDPSSNNGTDAYTTNDNDSYLVSLEDLYDTDSFLNGLTVETWALVAVYVPVFLLAVLGNVFVLMVILMDSRMRKSAPNFFLCNLAVADLLGE